MRRHWFILVGALVCAGCGSAPSVQTVSEALKAPGIDATLSLSAFDAVAAAYQLHLTETGEEPTSEAFLAWSQDQSAARDMFAQHIELTVDEAGTFLLQTAGADGVPQTDDDYWKRYPTSHVTTSGDLQ